MAVTIYSDGGADPNPGRGGWAAILRQGDREKILTGHEEQTTNNRMELTAAIRALQALRQPSQVEFYTDSQYLRLGITEWIEGWAANDWQRKGGKAIANVDLWQTLWSLAQDHEIEWHWVRGHSGHAFNERVDELAREARLKITPKMAAANNGPRLYVRASCKGNPGPGGWGVVLEEGEETTQKSGSEPDTTNNRMELLGAIAGLRMLPPGSELQLVTTSDYLFQGATRWIHGWRQREWMKKRSSKTVANADLWQELDKLLKEYQIRWINAKGQKGKEMTGLQEAGRLATEAIDVV